jgi:hypothetical protein
MLIRRQVRAQLDFAGIRWTEYKGWTSSTFVIRGSGPEIDAVLDWVKRLNGGSE